MWLCDELGEMRRKCVKCNRFFCLTLLFRCKYDTVMCVCVFGVLWVLLVGGQANCWWCGQRRIAHRHIVSRYLHLFPIRIALVFNCNFTACITPHSLITCMTRMWCCCCIAVPRGRSDKSPVKNVNYKISHFGRFIFGTYDLLVDNKWNSLLWTLNG